MPAQARSRGGARGARRSLVAVIDDGTKTVSVAIYDTESLQEVCSHQMDKSEDQPQEGWYEQDPREILSHARACAHRALQLLQDRGYSKEDIATLGITNQRETTIAWDKVTGEPLHPAILWKDSRTASTVDAVLARVPRRNKNHVKGVCGLPVSAYFSALKMRWLLDHVPAVQRAARDARLLFGTVDSWIVWNLTGGASGGASGGAEGGAGGVHVTDVTNASRTLLMNLDTLNWDPMLCRLFGVPRDTLADIRSSAELVGRVRDGSAFDGLSISAMLGNQQAALLGQGCVRAGQAKSTLRSGAFLLYNTGAERVASTHGLLTTVAYRLGPAAPTVYALEGSIAVAGDAVKFLRDNLRLIGDVRRDTEPLAGQVFSTGDVYLVPAFSGLYAPYWRKDARGIICGLTAFTTKSHIVRAGLEAVCFQTRDILEAMNRDCGVPLSKLHVDGRMTANQLLMQLQADLIGIPVLRAVEQGMPARGAAIAAGVAAGLCSLDDVTRRLHTHSHTFLPTTTHHDRDARYTKWKMAVQRSLGWASSRKPRAMTGQRFPASAPPPPDDTLPADSNQMLTNGRKHRSVDLPHGGRKFSVDLPHDGRKLSVDLPQNGRKLSVDLPHDGRRPSPEYSAWFRNRQESESSTHSNASAVEDLLKYSARRFSAAAPGAPGTPGAPAVKRQTHERTILDDVEYYERKKECDYGMCQCCQPPKIAKTDWQSIEEAIENDPEIIFDPDNNPIVVEPVKETVGAIGAVGAVGAGGSFIKRINLNVLPNIFKTIRGKLTNNSSS